MVGGFWRPQDEALLRRIEDEEILERIWALESGGASAIHPRAAGLVAQLRTVEEGREAIATRDLEAIARLLRPEPLSSAPPEMIHLLAVYEERLAAALIAEPARWIDRRLAGLAAWLALAEEESYLRRVGQAQMVDGGAEAALQQWRRPLAELGETALHQSRALGPRGRSAMSALARISEAVGRAGCSVELARRVHRAAERHRVEAVEAALATVGDAIADATARGRAEREGPKIAERLLAVWHWAEWDEHVERFAVDEITPMAWHVYQREPGYANLRAIIEPLEPIVDHLAERVERDPTRVAYAAPVAQIFVFRSEMALGADDQRALAERAVRLCPTHRNGRLVLARTLAREVQTQLDRGFVAALDRAELKAKIERARTLYPRTKGLAELEERVDDLAWWEKGWRGR